MVNANPLIYKKKVAILARVLLDGEVVVDNVVVANLTIRSSVEKDILGYIPCPEEGWKNKTYELQLLIKYAGGNITYGPTKKVPIKVTKPIPKPPVVTPVSYTHLTLPTTERV